MLSLSRQFWNPKASRRAAMTLVELLIVVGLITVLMGLVAASIRPALENRKSKEASRILVSTFAQAKAQAMATGRRVGVWVQGGDSLGDVNFNFATELYMAEEPPPYSGDLETSHAVIQNGAVFPFPTGPTTSIASGRCWLRKSDNALFAIGANTPLLLSDDEIRIGDRIKFNYRGASYRIVQINPAPSDLTSATPPGPNHLNKFATPAAFLEIVYALDGYPTPYGGEAWPDGGAFFNYGPDWGPTGGPKMARYQILRQPRRVGRAISLPVGTCIDLRSSGLQRVFEEDLNGDGVLDPIEDLNNNGFRDVVPWNGMGPIPGVEFRIVDLNGDGVLDPAEDGNATALVVFGSDSQVNSIVRNYEFSRDLLSPPDTVHFLIGSLERMGVAGTLPYITGGTAVEFNENLVDPSSLWVSVNVRNGNATSANNNWVPQGSFSRTLHFARLFANEAQNLGAR